MNKQFKYRLLRHLPGVPGLRYEHKLMRLHARTIEFEAAVRRCEGTTCIDLGANVGKYTRKMASGAKQVIAFEPDPWACAALRANVADLDNVRIENAAAGTREGRVLLYRHARFEEDPRLYSESSSVVSSKRNVTGEDAVEVRRVDFIGYLEDLDTDIGLIKMDVEGAEVTLLEALFDRPDILRRIDCLFAETHETRIPGHEPRVKALRERAREMERPYINLYWN